MQENVDSPPRAPWRDRFDAHLAKKPAVEFSFATAFHDSNGKVYPRVRTCIFRSFWAELKLRDSSLAEIRQAGRHTEGAATQGTNEDASSVTNATWEENPAIYESDMPSFTTDVRMDKAEQIESGSDGVGGQVECSFWVEPVSTQWRLKGRAFVVGGENEDGAEKESREEISKWMRSRSSCDSVISNESEKWSWEKEITAHFANMSPIMRGSFKNPPPGTPRSVPPEDPRLKMGEKVYDLHDPVARSNFRVVVIQPEDVEFVDVASMKRIRWQLHEVKGSEGREKWHWKEEELWP